MVQSNQVYTQSAKAPGDSGCIALQRKIRSEGQIDTVEADALVVFGVRREVISDRIEVPILHEYAIGGSQRMVQETEIGRAPQIILVNAERIDRRILRLEHGRKGQRHAEADERSEDSHEHSTSHHTCIRAGARSALLGVLKDQLQAELQLPHVDSGAGAGNGSETARPHDRNSVGVETIVPQSKVGVPEVRVIQEVEHLEPELEISLFSDVEVFQRREIPIEDSRTLSHVSPCVAVGSEWL